MFRILLFILIVFFSGNGICQNVTISVNASEDKRPVSPYLYGRNNNFSNVFGTPTTAADIQLYKEAGLKFARENNGNNATKYNWKRKISSHPDWYNNVYDHDWDYEALSILTNFPDLQVMFGFQLLGKVAANKDNNFNDWGYNNSQWWEGVAQNLAGGGEVNSSGGTKALVEGDPDLYLMDWPADSTTAILDHWFGENGLGFDENRFQYWSMDNEPEIWSGTHDDVMPTQLSANEFMDKYFAVAKKARQKFPAVKLVGPVPANEWQWFKWGNESLSIGGQNYCWLEYFIKRVADEQKASGIKLLDVLDIHWYPTESSAEDVVQLHRVFYDENFDYPGANGVKTINGGWDNSQTKEYIFKRIEDWLDEHFGEGHGITLGMSEFGANTNSANVNAVLYASMLGTFANHDVEIFTPWTWKTGMWETLHLFSRYAKTTSVHSTSSLENDVSAYTTINDNADSMTVMIVNRDVSSSRTIKVNLTGYAVSAGDYSALELSSLPASETFKSHNDNALKNRTVSVSGNSFELTVPALSVTAVLLKGGEADVILSAPDLQGTGSIQLYPNPASSSFNLNLNGMGSVPSRVNIYNLSGQRCSSLQWEEAGKLPLNITTNQFDSGVYMLEIRNKKFTTKRKLVIQKN